MGEELDRVHGTVKMGKDLGRWYCDGGYRHKKVVVRRWMKSINGPRSGQVAV